MVFARQSLKKMFKLSRLLTKEVVSATNNFFAKVVWSHKHKLECVKYEVEVSCMFLCSLFGNTFKSFVHLYCKEILPMAMRLNRFFESCRNDVKNLASDI